MKGMTLNEITEAFESKLIDVLGTDARIVFPNQDADFSQETDILAIQKVSFGQVYQSEKGGPESLSQATGVYLVNLSVKNGQSLIPMKNVAQRIINVFRRKRIQCIICKEPYPRDVGEGDDGRYAFLVNIPWDMYFNTEEV